MVNDFKQRSHDSYARLLSLTFWRNRLLQSLEKTSRVWRATRPRIISGHSSFRGQQERMMPSVIETNRPALREQPRGWSVTIGWRQVGRTRRAASGHHPLRLSPSGVKPTEVSKGGRLIGYRRALLHPICLQPRVTTTSLSAASIRSVGRSHSHIALCSSAAPESAARKVK